MKFRIFVGVQFYTADVGTGDAPRRFFWMSMQPKRPRARACLMLGCLAERGGGKEGQNKEGIDRGDVRKKHARKMKAVAPKYENKKKSSKIAVAELLRVVRGDMKLGRVV